MSILHPHQNKRTPRQSDSSSSVAADMKHDQETYMFVDGHWDFMFISASRLTNVVGKHTHTVLDLNKKA